MYRECLGTWSCRGNHAVRMLVGGCDAGIRIEWDVAKREGIYSGWGSGSGWFGEDHA